MCFEPLNKKKKKKLLRVHVNLMIYLKLFVLFCLLICMYLFVEKNKKTANTRDPTSYSLDCSSYDQRNPVSQNKVLE